MMTNFEKLKDNLTVNEFISMILFNCDYCPAWNECQYYSKTVDGFECSDTLEKWCNRSIL